MELRLVQGGLKAVRDEFEINGGNTENKLICQTLTLDSRQWQVQGIEATFAPTGFLWLLQSFHTEISGIFFSLALSSEPIEPLCVKLK